jgi:hypothetical protein
LIGKTELACHAYQATGARRLYLNWIAKSERFDVREYVERFYVPVWMRMDELLGIRQAN